MMRTIVLAIAAILACSAAWAETKTNAEVVADLDRLVAATADGTKSWTVLKNGVVRHNASGLVCGGTVGDMPLIELRAGPPSPVPDGSVNCRYSNADKSAGYDVYVFSPGMALDPEDAFAAHRKALIALSPDAVPLKELPNVPGAKGEAFLITLDGKRTYTCLFVGTVRDWVVSVRFSTYAQPQMSEASARELAGPISIYAQAVAYRAMRGVVSKQLAMPDPQAGF
jgi:hypothetical protein